jgi:hypothetical protein
VASPILPEIAFIYNNYTEFNNGKQCIEINEIKAWLNKVSFPAREWRQYLNWSKLEDDDDGINTAPLV